MAHMTTVDQINLDHSCITHNANDEPIGLILQRQVDIAVSQDFSMISVIGALSQDLIFYKFNEVIFLAFDIYINKPTEIKKKTKQKKGEN